MEDNTKRIRNEIETIKMEETNEINVEKELVLYKKLEEYLTRDEDM